MLNAKKWTAREYGLVCGMCEVAPKPASRSRDCGTGMLRLVERAGFVTAVALVAALIVVAPAGADLVVMGAAADNTLIEVPEGNVSSGGSTGMFVGRNNQASNSRRRGAIMFDIAGSIPAGATINSVTLQLSQSAANTGAATISLHRLLVGWGEGSAFSSGGQGAPAGPGDATWLHALYNTSPWAAPGGDFDTSASTLAVVSDVGAYHWPSTTGLVDDVQGFLDTPGQNFGWALVGDETASQTAKRFSTREEPLVELRPNLIVEYTLVPEPTSAMMLLLAGWLCIGCRRIY